MTATAGSYPLVWDLDSLFPNPETDDFAAQFDDLAKRTRALAEQSRDLPGISGAEADVAGWTSLLEEYEQLEALAGDLRSHVGCHAAGDAANAAFTSWEGRLAALQPAWAEVRTNIEFAMKEASDDDLEALLAGDERLAEIRFFFDEARRDAAFRLPRELELLAAELDVDGIHGWGRLYDRLSGDLRVQVMEKGELVEKSPGQVSFDQSIRSVRENNFRAADKAWKTIEGPCADALNHIAGTRLTKYRRLGCTDHLDSPLRYNRMSRETLETMWSTITARKAGLVEYFSAKSKLLGIERPSWFDMQAPLPGHVVGRESTITYDAACDRIIETFSEFSGEFGDFARHALENGWIEAEDRSGKRQGGFCTGFTTKSQSRIFMTYTDTPDSMSTLAHELGHAYHTYALRDRPVLLREYPMTLAETASTFAEAVLGEKQLEEAETDGERLLLLDGMLSDAVAFLMNIHARFLFEDEFHRERVNGELAPERFSELMEKAQREAYLGALADDGWNPRFWVSKLHFYISGWPFYNFPYTFGYLLSLGLYALAAESGDADFPSKYREFLIATGDRLAEDAVADTLGHDLTQPDFWNRSLDVVERRVTQFVELASK